MVTRTALGGVYKGHSLPSEKRNEKKAFLCSMLFFIELFWAAVFYCCKQQKQDEQQEQEQKQKQKNMGPHKGSQKGTS